MSVLDIDSDIQLLTIGSIANFSGIIDSRSDSKVEKIMEQIAQLNEACLYNPYQLIDGLLKQVKLEQVIFELYKNNQIAFTAETSGYWVSFFIDPVEGCWDPCKLFEEWDKYNHQTYQNVLIRSHAFGR